MAQAFCHVIIKDFYLKQPSDYFIDYAKRYTDLPILVMLEGDEGSRRPGRYLRASDLVDNLGQENNPEWKTIGLNNDGELVSPQGSIGYRWGEKGKWNIEQKNGTTGEDIDLTLTLKDSHETCVVAFDYFTVLSTHTLTLCQVMHYNKKPCHVKPLRLS